MSFVSHGQFPSKVSGFAVSFCNYNNREIVTFRVSGCGTLILGCLKTGGLTWRGTLQPGIFVRNWVP